MKASDKNPFHDRILKCNEKVNEFKTFSKKFIRASTYANKNEISRRTVYNMIEDGRLCGIEIDGVTFVIK